MKSNLLIWVIPFFMIGSRTVALGAEMSPLNHVPDKMGQSLQQRMIWTAADAEPQSAFIAFRKQFNLTAGPSSAKIFLFADVRYLVWINGNYVLQGPARFDPKGPEYDTVEVGKLLHKGPNGIVVLVMANQSNGKMMLHAPGLTARLDVLGPQGARTVVTTDPTWKWSDKTRYRNPNVDWGNQYDVIDSTVEDGDWTQLAYDDRAWKSASKIDGTQWGPLSARRIPLLRDTPLEVKLNGQESPITISAGEVASFKTDHLVQAYTLIDFEAEPGTSFELPYANISYKARAGRQVYISSDTHGFKDGSIKVTSGKITIHSFKPVERLYPFDIVGSFDSNDPLLNKIWKMCARSGQVMSEDSYVDCSDRERTEWMDDTPPSYDVTSTAMAGISDNGATVYGDPRLLEELLRRTALSIQPEGWVKAHTCSDRFDLHAKMEDRACDWVQGARLYYESTGNSAPIREIWPAVVRQMNYFLERRSSRGLVIGRDWVMWFNPMGYETCEPAGLNAFVYKALVDATFLAQVIGKTQDAKKFDQAARDLSHAFNKVLWNDDEGTYYSGYDTPQSELPSGVVKGRTGVFPDWNLPPKPPTLPNNLIASTSYPALIALDQGIVPADRQKRVTKYLFANPDPKPRIMYYYYYWKQLYEANEPGNDKQILDAMRQKWKFMADFPWQTSFEEFDIGSQAHCYGMFPGYFLSAYVLGVRPDGPPTQKHLLINPHLGDLAHAEGKVVTESGPVHVSWTVHSNQLDFEFEIPKGVTATLKLPSHDAKSKLKIDQSPDLSSPADKSPYQVHLEAGLHKGTLSF